MLFGFVDSDAGSLACTRLGQGNILLVPVHGWACRRSHWAGQLPLLAQFGEVLAADLPGHGDSIASPPATPTVAGLASTLTGVIEAEQAGREVVLIGHSMGGAVALEAARQLSSVRAVVLVDTFVIPYGDLPEEQAAGIEQAFSDDFVSAMKNLVESNTCDDLPDAIGAQLHHDMAAADTRWALPLWHDLLRWQPDEALRHSGGRIHAINGCTIPEVARARCAPHVSEVVIPEAKHFPQLETSASFNARLREVLQHITG